MGDYYTIIIPDAPHYVPSEEAQRRAVERLLEIAPNADEIMTETSETVRFVDCGENFETVACPDCASELDIGWWEKRMDEGYKTGFQLQPIEMPCCGKRRTLNDLKYDAVQGFARFSLGALNADIGVFPAREVKRFEEILGCKIRIVPQSI